MKQIVKVLILDRKGRVLLVRRSPLEAWDPGLWGLPGGEVQLGEQLQEAAQREVAEEVGLKIQVAAKPQYVYYYPDNQVESATAEVFFLIADNKWEGKLLLNVEHTEAKWFNSEQWQCADLTPSAQWMLKNYFLSLRV